MPKDSTEQGDGIQEHFYRLADALGALLHAGEVSTCSFSAEESDFVRFTRGRIRQAGTVAQRFLTADLIAGRQHASGTLSLSGDLRADRERLASLVEDLRVKRACLPEDPWLLYATEVHSTARRAENRLPDAGAVLAAIEMAARDLDLVGLYASGGTHAGFANSLGQRNWHTSYSYNFDWSLHLDGGKAVKARYAGIEWQPAEFERVLAAATDQLALLSRPLHAIRPGRYRAYLAPAALEEIIGLLAWDGFSLRAHRTKTTALLRMIETGIRLHPAVTIVENTREGVAPEFQEAGFIRPPEVGLIRNGACEGCLVSPRSAQEYGVAPNGASAGEVPLSVDMAAGDVPRADILRQLDTGIYVGNLWYLNYSDKPAGRLTGMTRFGTFWVEGGVVKGPVPPMRFDEAIYRVLGDGLLGLTAERDLLLDADTYGERSTRSARLPGALVDGFTCTL